MGLLDRCRKKKEDHSDGVGGEKDIGYVGGTALLINNITGPGLVTIPFLFQQCGYVTPIVCMVFCMVMSSVASTLLCQAMTKVPGNNKFQGRIEFTTLAKHFFWKWAFYLTIILFALSLMSQLISAIVESAQTMDLAVLAIFKRTWALEFYPHFGFTFVDTPGSTFSPFGDAYVLTVGFLITLALTLPLGLFNLDDNIIIQIAAIFCLILIFIEWFVCFFIVGLDFTRIPAFTGNQSQLLGTIIFNYAFVITVPSWVNEKSERVKINPCIWTATTISTVFYTAVGLFGGWAFKYGDGEDLLDALNNRTVGALHVISQISVYLFPAVALMSSIPVFSIIIRYNLVENKICRKVFANFWAVVFPWVISLFFYAGKGLLLVINTTSLLVNGFINFVIPLIIYLISQRRPVKPLSVQEVTHDEPEESEEATYIALPQWKYLNHKGCAIGFITASTIMIFSAIVLYIIQLASGHIGN